MSFIKTLSCFVLATTAWAADTSLLRHAPTKASLRTNPFEASAEARRAGAKLYARECAACHGENREGRGKAPTLDRADIQHAPAGVLFWVLTNGALHQGMPSFAHLPAPQRWQIITWL